MKRSDFKRGKPAYIIRMWRSTSLPNICIEEVEIEGIKNGYPSVWDWANEESVYVELKDVYSTYEDARKKLLRYLSKQFQKHSKGTV